MAIPRTSHIMMCVLCSIFSASASIAENTENFAERKEPETYAYLERDYLPTQDEVMLHAFFFFIMFQILFHGLRLYCPMLFGDVFSKLTSPMQAYWISTIVSSFHAILVVTMTLHAFYVAPELLGSDFFLTSPQSVQIFKIFLGYISCDTTFSVYYNSAWPGWKANLIHHFSAMWCWSLLATCGFGHLLGLIGILCEITTPLVNLRWSLHTAGMKSSYLYFVNGMLMTVLWFVFRILGFFWVGIRLYEARDSMRQLWLPHLAMISFVYPVGYGLQIFWFSKILRGALKSIRGSKRK